jgi:hypothetical protein
MSGRAVEVDRQTGGGMNAVAAVVCNADGMFESPVVRNNRAYIEAS